MRNYKNSTVKVNKSVICRIANKKNSKVLCNVCGEEILNDSLGHLDNYVTLEKKWGYGTKFDGEHHSIDICCKCYENLINSLKLPPTRR